MIEYFKKNTTAYWSGVFLFVGLIILDQLSKNYARRVFSNAAFAFSLPLPIWLIYLTYFIVMLVMLVYFVKAHNNFSKAQFFAWIFIFAGAVSNIGERLILGYVRDWIYIFTGVFNFADFYIILGIIILIFYKPK